MTILFGPNYRATNAYQDYLSKELEARGMTVKYGDDLRRFFPFWRELGGRGVDVVHLHWPEAYWNFLGRRIKSKVRYFPLTPLLYLIDLRLMLLFRKTRLVVTAHNLWPHTNGDGYWVRMAFRQTARMAAKIIAHSESAADEVAREWQIDRAKIVVIPHGDLSRAYGRMELRGVARARLPIPDDLPMFLMFGMVKAYKGVEEMIEFWKRTKPRARLAVVGNCNEPGLAERLRAAAEGCPSVYLSVDHWLTDEELVPWLAGAVGVIFNYTRVLTSGAASLTRSLGIPILIHRRAHTVDLGEPHPTVVRYGDMGAELEAAITKVIALSEGQAGRERDGEWDAAVAWPGIAEKTAAVYREAVAGTRG